MTHNLFVKINKTTFVRKNEALAAPLAIVLMRYLPTLLSSSSSIGNANLRNQGRLYEVLLCS